MLRRGFDGTSLSSSGVSVRWCFFSMARHFRSVSGAFVGYFLFIPQRTVPSVHLNVPPPFVWSAPVGSCDCKARSPVPIFSELTLP